MANLIAGTVYEIDGAPTTYHITLFPSQSQIDQYHGSNQNLYSLITGPGLRQYGCVETISSLKTQAG